MTLDRRDFLQHTLAVGAALAALPAAMAQGSAAPGGIDARDRVFITNEDSNTLVVIDPRRNAVETTINLTSFDEDPRPRADMDPAAVQAHTAAVSRVISGLMDGTGKTAFRASTPRQARGVA